MERTFAAWRQAQAAVAELEQLLEIAENPLSAEHSPDLAADLRVQLAAARAKADAALVDCLEESGRNRRSHRRIGVQSTNTSIRGDSRP